ncbi:hypothetical protein PENSPDRAFT_752303 [Peniophora sp. CONT]|nr:hypothetical protein PENSPDRAFT_752303 [Peniophora sp. CONT]
MLSLQSLKESSTAFPPLQSVLGGLLQLLNTYDTMMQNAGDRQRLYDRIDAIQDSLIIAWGNDDSRLRPFTNTQLRALEAFGMSIQRILHEANSLSASGSSPLRQFVLARRHKGQISGLLSSLTQADDDFRRCIQLDNSHRIVDVQLTAYEHHAATQTGLRTLQIMMALSTILFA